MLGCHKFCLSIASIGCLSTVLNHTVLARSALKQYFHQKKMSQCTLCEKMKPFLPDFPEIWPKECREYYELLVPFLSYSKIIKPSLSQVIDQTEVIETCLQAFSNQIENQAHFSNHVPNRSNVGTSTKSLPIFCQKSKFRHAGSFA